MKAVLSVVGKDAVGILAKVATNCAKYQANVEDVTQSVIDNYFAMFMFVNVDKLTVEFNEFVDLMSDFGKQNSLEIHIMHEDIFNLMHNI